MNMGAQLINQDMLAVNATEVEEDGCIKDVFRSAVANQVAITIRNREQIWSELLSTTSHQLRSFLTPVKICIDNMLCGAYGPINDKQRSRLEMAFASLNAEVRLITNLLDLARIVKEKASLEEPPSSGKLPKYLNMT